MKYTQEKIDALAARIIDKIPLFLFESRGTFDGTYCIPPFHCCVSDQVRDLNRTHGTRTRKKIGTLGDILSQRGFRCTEDQWDGCIGPPAPSLSVQIGRCRFKIVSDQGISFNVGKNYEELNFYIPIHCTASEEDIADMLECISAIDEVLQVLIEKRCAEKAREKMVSKVEFPLIEQQTADFLGSRGINYTLARNRYGANTLSIQITGYVWMKKDVNSDDLEQDLRIVPYLIARPDCITRDGRGFEMYNNRNWNKKGNIR